MELKGRVAMQLKDREELEAKYAEAAATLKQLRAEKGDSAKGLQAEVAALAAQVAAAEKAQRAAEAALATGTATSAAEQQRLRAQQQQQQQEITVLQVPACFPCMFFPLSLGSVSTAGK